MDIVESIYWEILHVVQISILKRNIRHYVNTYHLLFNIIICMYVCIVHIYDLERKLFFPKTKEVLHDLKRYIKTGLTMWLIRYIQIIKTCFYRSYPESHISLFISTSLSKYKEYY